MGTLILIEVSGSFPFPTEFSSLEMVGDTFVSGLEDEDPLFEKKLVDKDNLLEKRGVPLTRGDTTQFSPLFFISVLILTGSKSPVISGFSISLSANRTENFRIMKGSIVGAVFSRRSISTRTTFKKSSPFER